MRIFELPSRGKHLFNDQRTARIAIYMYAFRRIEMIFTFRPFWNEWHVTRAHAIRPGVGSVERTDGREEKNNVRPETWTRRTYRPARSNFIPEQTREVERRAKWKWPTDTCPLLSKEVPRILSAPFTVSSIASEEEWRGPPLSRLPSPLSPLSPPLLSSLPLETRRRQMRRSSNLRTGSLLRGETTIKRWVVIKRGMRGTHLPMTREIYAITILFWEKVSRKCRFRIPIPIISSSYAVL